MSEDSNLVCSFCSKSRKDVTKMIVGASKVSICNECVNLCNEILDEDIKKTNLEKAKSGKSELLNPVAIKEYLDQYVIGQDHAKTVLSVAVANHYKRITMPPENFDLDKSNVLILGATGSGKTLLARTIAKYLNVPIAMADATTLTESGYVGDDVENVITKLYHMSNGDKYLTERGIVFIDEIDKICRKNESTSITRDVSGEGVQQGLLKIVEGTTCRVPPQGGRKHPDATMVEIDTKNILFIVGGAFVDLERQMEKQSNSIGFTTTLESKSEVSGLANVQPKDLVKYGLIPEFVGRFSMITHVNHLSELQLIRVLTDPRDSIIKQYEYMFGLDDIQLKFTKSAKLSIAKKAKELGTNARGLRNILDTVLLPFQFDAQEMSSRGVKIIEITDKTVDTQADPVLIFRNDNSKKNASN
jgi:ATP-dependent Clp protease ATP-binding subunit ClpX